MLYEVITMEPCGGYEAKARVGLVDDEVEVHEGADYCAHGRDAVRGVEGAGLHAARPELTRLLLEVV